MKYISDIFALNILCELDTPGDWHYSGLPWESVHLRESEGSVWGDYGIEANKKIPGFEHYFNVANHIRALLDMIQDGMFGNAQGMRDSFISNEKYTNEIFEKVIMLSNKKNWKDIDIFMGKEYMFDWISFKILKTI